MIFININNDDPVFRETEKFKLERWKHDKMMAVTTYHSMCMIL